jgi:hypothetical protein
VSWSPRWLQEATHESHIKSLWNPLSSSPAIFQAIALTPSAERLLSGLDCSIVDECFSGMREAAMRLDAILRYWRGEGPLWRLYWIWGVLVSCVLALVVGVPAAYGWIGPATTFALLALGAVYTIWILVSVWRCAFNIEGVPLGIAAEAWGMLARWLTVAWAINAAAFGAILLQSTLCP